MSSTQFSLNLLPNEFLSNMFQCLSRPNNESNRLVCRLWDNIIRKNSERLQKWNDMKRLKIDHSSIRAYQDDNSDGIEITDGASLDGCRFDLVECKFPKMKKVVLILESTLKVSGRKICVKNFEGHNRTNVARLLSRFFEVKSTAFIKIRDSHVFEDPSLLVTTEKPRILHITKIQSTGDHIYQFLELRNWFMWKICAFCSVQVHNEAYGLLLRFSQKSYPDSSNVYEPLVKFLMDRGFRHMAEIEENKNYELIRQDGWKMEIRVLTKEPDLKLWATNIRILEAYNL